MLAVVEPTDLQTELFLIMVDVILVIAKVFDRCGCSEKSTDQSNNSNRQKVLSP